MFGLLVFYSGRIVILGLMLKSLIHFELTFVHGVRYSSNFIILHVAVQFPNTIYWGDYPFYSVCSWWPCWKLVDNICLGLFPCCLFCSIILWVCFLCQIILFLIRIEKNTSTKLLFAYYLLKALSIYSSKYTMSGTEDAIRLLLGWACSSYSHPFESSQFMPGTDL